MFKAVQILYGKIKPRQVNRMMLTCECGILKEDGGSDRCPRCGDKMKRKKYVDN
jgi:hypothetical protein